MLDERVVYIFVIFFILRCLRHICFPATVTVFYLFAFEGVRMSFPVTQGAILHVGEFFHDPTTHRFSVADRRSCILT